MHEYPYAAKEGAAMVGMQQGILTRQDRTVGENLDAKIQFCEAELQKLRDSRNRLEDLGLLDLKQSDVRELLG